MAVSEILGLFQTPDQYAAAQDAALQQQFERRATLSPFQRASVLGQQAGYSAAQGIGGALGGTDPQLEMISRRNVLLSQLNPDDPESYAKVAQAAARIGDPQFALVIAQEGRKAESGAALARQRKREADALLQQQAAQKIVQSAFVPSREIYGEDIMGQQVGVGMTAPSFDIARVAPQLLGNAAGRMQLEEVQKAQTAIDAASANQLAAQLFNPDGSRNKAVESKLRSTLAGQQILKAVEPETKVLKKGDTLATLDQSTGTYKVITPTGGVTTPPGANPITTMLEAGSITPTVRAYAKELETQWPNLDADERRNELSKLATKNQTATKIAQKDAETKVGGSDKVQSSKVTPNGTTIIVMKDGSTRVVSASGENLTGQARADAIIESEQFGAETQGTRAQARVGGELTAKQVGSAFTEIGKIRKNIGNIDEAIKAIDDGANTGVIASKFPNITTASITLNNVRSQLGLDVIGSVTFGALSEGELNLALDTALPTTLQPKALRQYLTDKKAAQEKLVGYLSKQISYLSKPGNNLAGWLEEAGKQGQSGLPAGVTVKKKSGG